MKTSRVRWWILSVDLVWCIAAFFAAETLRYGAFWKPPDQGAAFSLLPFLPAAGVLWTLLCLGMNLDCFRGGWRWPAVVAQTFVAVACLMSILLSVGYLEREYVSRLVLSYFGVLLFVGFLGIRSIIHSLLLAKYRRGDVRRVAVVGTGQVARELALKIKRHPEMLWEVVGFIYPEDENNQTGSAYEPTAVSALCVTEVLSAYEISDVIIALPTPSVPEVLKLAYRCRERRIAVSIVPQPYELYLSRPALLDLDGIPILELQDVFTSDLFVRAKRFLDIVLGSLLAVVAMPILLLPVITLRITKGQAFCWEIRCGHFGKSFAMLRLNVDRQSADATRFERVLAVTSLTELPQLWNVLRGEMSLVGPRPEPFDRVCRYSEWQQQRLTVKPGMTGLAQVQGLRDQHLSEAKTRLDLQYLLNCSLWTDLSLLLQTFWTLGTRLVKRKGAVVDIGIDGAVSEAVNSQMQQEI